MNQFQRDLYNNLMALCVESEAFYYVDQTAQDILGQRYNYRVFTYRLASYSDFLKPDALECRGHTFLMNADFSHMYLLASLPMGKFFNDSENPMTMNLDYSKIVKIMDKLDGSLISTAVSWVGGRSPEVILKSKTSFSSSQAKDAMALLCMEEYKELYDYCHDAIRKHRTVNFEFCSNSNQIVLAYEKPMLKVLNVRSNLDGSYISDEEIHALLSSEFIVNSHPIPDDPAAFVESIYDMVGIEGFVIQLENGQFFKVKNSWYTRLHSQKSNVNAPCKLFEACVYEQSDDLRALFKDDPLSVAKINEMETKVAGIYNHLHKRMHDFYNLNKHLDRKSYAISGLKELENDGIFSLAMNLYLGKDADLKAFMVKNYKKFGITDSETVED